MRQALLLFSLAALLGGCSQSSARLEALRCGGPEASPCQSLEDPFLVQLHVDYDDPEDVLPEGRLHLRLDGQQTRDFELGPLLGQRLAGTAVVPVPLPASVLVDGRQFEVRAWAVDAQGKSTNEVAVDLVIRF